MNMTDVEFQSLKDARNGAEYNAAIQRMKDARAGEYPEDWYPRVIMSGFQASRERDFGMVPGRIKIIAG